MVFLLIHDDRMAAKVGYKHWYNSVYGRLGGWFRVRTGHEINIKYGVRIGSRKEKQFSLLLDIDRVLKLTKLKY